jgi:hypothetical protein
MAPLGKPRAEGSPSDPAAVAADAVHIVSRLQACRLSVTPELTPTSHFPRWAGGCRKWSQCARDILAPFAESCLGPGLLSIFYVPAGRVASATSRRFAPFPESSDEAGLGCTMPVRRQNVDDVRGRGCAGLVLRRARELPAGRDQRSETWAVASGCWRRCCSRRRAVEAGPAEVTGSAGRRRPDAGSAACRAPAAARLSESFPSDQRSGRARLLSGRPAPSESVPTLPPLRRCP